MMLLADDYFSQMLLPLLRRASRISATDSRIYALALAKEKLAVLILAIAVVTDFRNFET
jgi:hypothetical protein